jgi:hypothetical protein
MGAKKKRKEKDTKRSEAYVIRIKAKQTAKIRDRY